MTSLKRIQGLDLLRFIAISLVVLLHASEVTRSINPILYWFFKIGWIGVDLFFVLSGYLIASQVFKTKVTSKWKSLKEFWIKRWWRTLPLYFFALFVYAVIKPLLGFPFQQFSYKFFFFLQNFSRIHDFTQSWSLCIEEHFYIIFPILAFVFSLKNNRAVVWLIFVAGSFLARLYYFKTYEIVPTPVGIDFSIRFVTQYHLDGIAMGVFLAKTKGVWLNWNRPVKIILGLIGTFLVTYFPYTTPYVLPGYSSVWMFSVLAIGFSMVLIALHNIKVPRACSKPIELIALWSYGIYLWNGLVIRLFHHLKLGINDYLIISVFCLISILVAIPTYYFIEKPFLKLRDKLLAR